MGFFLLVGDSYCIIPTQHLCSSVAKVVFNCMVSAQEVAGGAIVSGAAAGPAITFPSYSDALPAPRCDAWSRWPGQLRKRGG